MKISAKKTLVELSSKDLKNVSGGVPWFGYNLFKTSPVGLPKITRR